MANFQIPENPGYAEEIRKFETTDPAHADLFNAVVQQLLENDAHLKKGKQDAIAIDSALSATSTNPVQNKAVKAALDGKSGTGHTHAAASTTSSGFMPPADKRKLDGIDESANNYTHPATHPASMVTQDTAHRFVTDAEKKAWDGTYEQATGYTDQKVAELIGGDPETLGTLKDFAEAVKENGDLISGLNDAIGKKASQAELDTHTGNGTIHVTAADKAGWDKDISERAVSFDKPAGRSIFNPGDTLKAIAGKIWRFLSDIKAVAFTGSYSDLSDKPAIPKAVRVKGENEGAYRDGDVSLTAGNIGIEKCHTYSLKTTSANMDADLKAFFGTLPDECFTIYMEAGATYRVDGYKFRKYGVLRRSVYVSSRNAVGTHECTCLNGVWGDWKLVYTESYKPTPAGIGAVSEDYLAGHFVADYIKQKGIMLGSVGWWKIAELSSGDTSMASCIVDIKREYMTAEEEYHRFSLCAIYGRCEFSPILDKTRHHLITKARVITGAAGKCYIEVYYNYTNNNHVNITIENAATTEYSDREIVSPVADTETPGEGVVSAVYDMPVNFNAGMLAKADGSNVDGVWENLTAGATLGKFDNNGDLGRKPPSYIGAGRAKLRMMRGFKGLSDAPNYMDCLLMNAYSDSTQKYATALGIVKASGIPRAYIAVGDSNNASTWESQAELVTDKNIGSMTAGKAKALETGGVGDRGTPIYIGADGTPNECNGYFAKMEGRFSGSFQSTSYQRVLDLWMHESDRQGVISMGGSKYGVLLRVVGDSRYGGFLEDIFLVFQYGSSFISGDYSKNIIIGVGGISVGELYLSAGSSDCGTTTVEVRMKVSGGAQFTVNGIYIIHL